MATIETIELRVELNPFGKGQAVAPPPRRELQLACCYEVDIGLGEFDEAAYLRRTKTHDELWTRDFDYPQKFDLSARAPRGGSDVAAALRLLKHLVRSRFGHAWPRAWRDKGIIDEATFRQALSDVKAGLDRNKKESRRRGRNTKIVKAARRLGLGPSPDSRSPTIWQARCPGTNHSIWLCVESNTFGCGYCGQKGGPEVLENFVRQRTGKPAISGGAS